MKINFLLLVLSNFKVIVKSDTKVYENPLFMEQWTHLSAAFTKAYILYSYLLGGNTSSLKKSYILDISIIKHLHESVIKFLL